MGILEIIGMAVLVLAGIYLTGMGAIGTIVANGFMSKSDKLFIALVFWAGVALLALAWWLCPLQISVE